jgi:hypothetical protein
MVNLSQHLNVKFDTYIYPQVDTGRLRDLRKLTGAQYNMSLLPSQGIIYTDDGGSVCLRNDGTHLPDYMAS